MALDFNEMEICHRWTSFQQRHFYQTSAGHLRAFLQRFRNSVGVTPPYARKDLRKGTRGVAHFERDLDQAAIGLKAGRCFASVAR